MKKVPEAGKKQLGAEEQMRVLFERLAGHPVFRRCRGEFDEVPVEELLNAGKPSSPSATLEAFSRWYSDRRIMLTMLAQFKRDGHTVAFKELRKALCDPDYVMIGEIVPVGQTEPGVLVIPDPENTFLLTRWLYTTSIEDARAFVTDGNIPEDRTPCGALTNEVFQKFPGLAERFKDPIRRCLETPVDVLYKREHEVWKKLRGKYSRPELSTMWVDPRRTSGWRGERNAIGVFVLGKTQADVLALFNRDEQRHIATWRFDYPKVDNRRLYGNSFSHGPDMWIGLHPESEHKTWRSQWPSRVSKGFASGHGAVILDEVCLGENALQPPSGLSPYAPLHAPYRQFCGGDLSSRRFVIGFEWGRE